MKSAKQILLMLKNELDEHLEKTISFKTTSGYFNELLGDTSFLLAGLLYAILKINHNDWRDCKWIDDSLLTYFDIVGYKLVIKGVMIYGKQNTSQQWVDPFVFEVKLVDNRIDVQQFSFFFRDLNRNVLKYENFSREHTLFDFSSKTRWEYIFNVDIVNNSNIGF